jgi:hypothetical protein
MRSVACLVLAWVVAVTASAKPLDWSSAEGISRLERSKHKVDFFPLVNHFESQKNKVYCGPAAGAIVLNALRLGQETLPKDATTFDAAHEKFLPEGMDARFPKYTQRNFFIEGPGLKTVAQVAGEKINGEADFGFQLKQYKQMLEAHGLDVEAVVVDDKLDGRKVKAALVKNLATKGDFVLVNFSRKTLEQKGSGHISPLGAYDAKSDSFLVLDVNPNTTPWFWVTSDELIAAMRTKDTVENRGFLLVRDGKKK